MLRAHLRRFELNPFAEHDEYADKVADVVRRWRRRDFEDLHAAIDEERIAEAERCRGSWRGEKIAANVNKPVLMIPRTGGTLTGVLLDVIENGSR